jgi:hypothetical protein
MAGVVAGRGSPGEMGALTTSCPTKPRPYPARSRRRDQWAEQELLKIK